MSVSLGGGALGIQKEGDVLSLETIIVRITSPFSFIGRHRPYIIPSFLFANSHPSVARHGIYHSVEAAIADSAQHHDPSLLSHCHLL